MNNTQKVLQRHIEDIGAELDCDIDWICELSGMMYVEEEPPRIEIPRKEFWIGDTLEKAYVISLHELGHIYFKHTQGRPPFEHKVFYFENGVLKSEAEAWKFALENSIIDWSEETKAFALNKCIMSYYHGSIMANGKLGRLWNGNRHHYAFTFDIPDDFFWNVTRELGYDG